ncbi:MULTISPECIES: hypothetical protein [unclassified Sulfitobacter]|uniref:hypothetical protein n=1 Tax=unclassified Sulfitobacter TaxID=196795 RepID=UPI000A684D3A|nr:MULTISPECIES: hypothetical protein [unclassified Sulfitobacter]
MDMAKSKSKRKSPKRQIIECAEQHFGQKVERVSTPGGESRSSMRLYLPDRVVIATLRPNFRRTHLEAFVLEKLSAHCADLPECLGVVGKIMFQSDVGKRRLNMEIAEASPERRLDLSAEAIESIFRIHAAARKTELHTMMPHLGLNREWVMNFVDAIDFLKDLGGGISDKFDRVAAYETIATEPRQFLKWDCRSGNAAIGADEKLRWFDFEYAGMRHGAEDVAWLIGDEAWPVAPQKMLDVLNDAFDPDYGVTRQDYMEYLSVYLTFHCVQRLKLISKESKKRGWLSKEKIRKYDDAGVHPDFAAQMCRVGAFYSARSPITKPLTRNFLAALHGFIHVGKQQAQASVRDL